MPLKTSWLNKELILQIIRSTSWISILYFFGLLFALPIRMLMMYTAEEESIAQYNPVNSLFHYEFVIQLGLTIIIPVLLSVFLFRYLQVKQSADLMHSLPIRREKLFHHYVLSGIILLILPIIFVAFIIMGVHAAFNLSSFFHLKDIGYWVGTTIVLDLLIFSAGVFVAMITGISAVQGVLTYILLLFPAGMTVLIFYNLQMLLFGFPTDFYLHRNLETLSPLTYATLLDGRPLQKIDVILYLFFTFLFYVFSILLYKKRKVESASEAIAFTKLRSIFKYGVTFCTMLVGGMYFAEVQNESFDWMIFGYIVGSIIGYYIANMLLEKSWRVFHKLKGLVIYGVVIAFVYIGIQGFGFYENNVPEQSEIKKVYLTDSPRMNLDPKLYGYTFTPDALQEKSNIELVRKLHQQIINDKKINAQLPENEFMRTAFFLYELENGKIVTRQYRVDDRIYEQLFKPIYESTEYKMASNEIFHIDADEVEYLNIIGNGPGKWTVPFRIEKDLKEIIELLRADILVESYEDQNYYSGRGSNIEIFLGKDHYVYLDFKPTYKGLEKWLKDRELLNQTTIVPEDISSIKIIEWDSKEMTHPDLIEEKIENSTEVLEIKDIKQIKEVLTNAGWGRTHHYIAIFHFKEGNYSERLYLDEEHAPEFVKAFFK
ncbi:DUF6449 domain-containing protein [Mesobacillus maritimus]|uniref:DUF6449 domain-containing protein n=1 Tax=Mesobacillus maritimus TaxID=1643336 RepID=UPI00203C8FBB|nr:DUF6449 domain-containing protein [Mesobacillus maritimus]MCM3584147.1 DUF6449 domain-containing protein [Mesobacillus maritimus]MCM3669391.1 DUF6449 domain-containing protein [Mesobacillus maritimus]